jgi:hypothetical protein
MPEREKEKEKEKESMKSEQGKCVKELLVS